MSQPIEIRTLSGVRLDVKADTTIEINMGGLSLLDLESRTATYSNQFEMPRTPVNDAEFQFASQPTRKNRPEIDVIIQKGLFQKKAILKVVDFDKNYKCSVSYTEGIIDTLKTVLFESVIETGTIYTESGTLTNSEKAQLICEENSGIFIPISYSRELTAIPLFTYASYILTRITDIYGYTFSGDLLTNADFIKYCFPCYNMQRIITYDSIEDETMLLQNYLIYETFEKVYLSDILKLICQVFACDFVISGNQITFVYLSDIISNTAVSVEGFTDIKKTIYPISFKNGIILYDVVDKTIGELYGSDSITSIGDEDKKLIQLKSQIPFYTVESGKTGYNLIGSDSYGKISSFVTKSLSTYTIKYDGINESVSIHDIEILTMSGVYSTVLNSIFANPVIIEAAKWFDPLTANSVMTQRIIISVQLGGRYLVDTMAYDLQSGNSKMKLIKL